MLLTVLVFLILLSILVLVHEVGHFVAAKKLGVKVEEFGFGLPPRIFGFRRGETLYSLNWLPIGGFVKLYGEDKEPATKNQPASPAGREPRTKNLNRAFYARPWWQRSIILVAGVTMNFLLAVIVISYLFTQGVMVPVERVHIEKVESNSPASISGLKEKDIVISVNGVKIKTADEFRNNVNKHLGKEITLTILRGADLKHYGEGISCDGCSEANIQVTPRKNPPLLVVAEEKLGIVGTFINSVKKILNIKPTTPEQTPRQGPLGVVISNFETRIYPWYEAPVKGLGESLHLSWQLLVGIGITLWKLITFQSVSQDVAGPFGIAEMTGQAVRFGVVAVLELLGLLSLNLAIVNILPFPALDGGRLLFVIIEAATGKKINAHWERYVHQVGMMILLFLILLVTLNDIVRIVAR